MSAASRKTTEVVEYEKDEGKVMAWSLGEAFDEATPPAYVIALNAEEILK